MRISGQHQLLFTPGPRLGWTFRDRRELVVPYPEPAPTRQVIQGRAPAQTAAADAAWRRPWKWAQWTAQRDKAPGVTLEEQYRLAVTEWHRRASRHESAELIRLAGQPEWGSVSSPSQRTIVFGGTLPGWRSLLAVHGASLLADRHLLVADLTGLEAASVLASTAEEAGVPAVAYRLPHDLGRCGLIGELSPSQLADAIAEAMHAGTPGGVRLQRAFDARVIRQLTNVLATRGVTLWRLAAAVRTALGVAPPAGLLSAEEQERLGSGLLPPRYGEQAAESLGRLDAIISELAPYPADGCPAQPARCVCLATDAEAHGTSGAVLAALVIQWLSVRVSAPASPPPAVIVAGADEITRGHLERLAATCERHGVPLTLLFRHLRDEAVTLPGAGTTAFLRLSNQAEAAHAAAHLRSAALQPAMQGAGEYHVAPSALLNLPEFTMLLADRSSTSQRIRAVEFDVSIASRPGVSPGPLPPVSATRRSKAPWDHVPGETVVPSIRMTLQSEATR